MFAWNGILFNHESPRRGENFVTMKIVNGVKKIVEQERVYEKELADCIVAHESVHHNDNFEGVFISEQALRSLSMTVM